MVVVYVPGRPPRMRWSASSTPTSSPVSARQPPGVGTASEQRSASGSLAISRSASVSTASARARSSAPGSSGLGKAAVGKSGSGSACSATSAGSGKPARAKAARSTPAPTPCRAVCTVRSRRCGVSGTAATRSRYESSTSPPSTAYRSDSGTVDSGPTAAMAASMRASAGGAICAPSAP